MLQQQHFILDSLQVLHELLISRNLESGCQYHLSKKTAEPEWFVTLVMSGPTRYFPNWGLLFKIALRVLKSSASCSGEIDSLICLGYRSGSEKQNQRLTLTFFVQISKKQVKRVYLSRKIALRVWFDDILETSGPTRKLPKWGLPLRICLNIWKSFASSSGESVLLNSLKWLGSGKEINKGEMVLWVNFPWGGSTLVTFHSCIQINLQRCKMYKTVLNTSLSTKPLFSISVFIHIESKTNYHNK